MRRRQVVWWILALAASFAIPLSSPWVGVLRDALESRLGGRYVTVLAIGLAAVGVAAFGVAVGSIRTRRARRYGLLAVALVLILLQPLLWHQGIRRVDLVERVHLVEYAGVGFLYLLALRSRVRDAALPVLAVLAAGYVGVADETIQWLSPARVGDIRDVLLNGWAGAIGAAFALALAPPRGLELRPEPSSLAAVRRSATLLLVIGAALFSQVGVGTVIHDPEAGAFVSHFAPVQLLRARDRRVALWSTAPPAPPRPLGREDPFLSEAGFHKAVRDRAAVQEEPARHGSKTASSSAGTRPTWRCARSKPGRPTAGRPSGGRRCRRRCAAAALWHPGRTAARSSPTASCRYPGACCGRSSWWSRPGCGAAVGGSSAG